MATEPCLDCGEPVSPLAKRCLNCGRLLKVGRLDKLLSFEALIIVLSFFVL